MSYLVVDPATQVGAVIDPVLNFDGKSGRTSTKHAQQIVDAASGLRIDWILETHGHADHLSAAPFLKQKLGGRIGIGVGIKAVQATWKDIYNLEPGFACDGSQFDKLFADGETFSIGTLEVTAWHTPGHTPACLTYIVRGKDGPACAFVGDTLFMPDYGTARTDFPGGDARTLYRSIHRISRLYRRRPASSSATITSPAAVRSPTRPRSPRSAATICTSRTASARTSSRNSAPSATRRCPARSCSCRRCR